MNEKPQENNNTKEQQNPNELEIFALATDPIYIGTGGYTIGRVDNTIVRDPITNVPKIPGSSLAGTWRYYVVLELYNHLKDEYKKDLRKREEKKGNIEELFNNPKDWMKDFAGNRFARIKCAGQDEAPNEEIDSEKNTGHCGHCIVCKGFGFSKKDMSWQGQIFFSDLNILFFPVFTIKGTKWITARKTVEEIKLKDLENTEKKQNQNNKNLCLVFEKLTENEIEGHINLGWLYLPYKFGENEGILKNKIQKILEKLQFQVSLSLKDIIIVPEDLFSHIVNSNLEVRTSVSIDPITGTAKEGALFTSEAIPRGTIFYGNIRIFNKSVFEGIDTKKKLKPLPNQVQLINALKDSRHYYESLGIGGMTTRGFGRLKITSPKWDKEDKNDTTKGK